MPRERLTELDRIIATNMRRYCMMRGYSREHLAHLTGETVEQVKKYETAEDRVPASYLALLATVLEVPLADFMVVAGGSGLPANRHTLRIVTLR